jgi:hypothetical protein
MGIIVGQVNIDFLTKIIIGTWLFYRNVDIGVWLSSQLLNLELRKDAQERIHWGECEETKAVQRKIRGFGDFSKDFGNLKLHLHWNQNYWDLFRVAPLLEMLGNCYQYQARNTVMQKSLRFEAKEESSGFQGKIPQVIQDPN